MPMSQTPIEKSGQFATAIRRAEELVSRAQQLVDAFATLTSQRFQQTTMRVLEQVRQPETAHEGMPDRQEGSQTVESDAPEQDEEMVGDMELLIGLATLVVGLQMRKITALVRENARDIWAEAQQIRNEQDIKGHSSGSDQ
jgi:hypothetical protein